MSPNVMKHRPYRGSPILKCVVSIWALLLREWGVEACQDGFGHFLFIHVARGCKGLPGWFGALFFHICPFDRGGVGVKLFGQHISKISKLPWASQLFTKGNLETWTFSHYHYPEYHTALIVISIQVIFSADNFSDIVKIRVIFSHGSLGEKLKSFHTPRLPNFNRQY